MIVLKQKKHLLAALLLLLLPSLSWAAPAGVFTKVEGSVDILRPREIAAVAVKAGDPVSMGDAIRTKRNGKAEIQFRDDSVVQLAPETRITIDEYSYSGGDTRQRGVIGLLRGKMRAIVSKARAAFMPVSQTDSGFNIRTPSAVAGVKGTDYIVYYERGITGVVFLDGSGIVFNPDKPEHVVQIAGGQITFIMRTGDVPLDAQPIANAFVAPLISATTPGGTGGAAGSGPVVVTAGLSDPTVNVTLTTPGGLAGQGGGGGILDPAPSGQATLLVIDLLSGGGAPPAVPPVIPVTETNTGLLKTPVTVNVTIP